MTAIYIFLLALLIDITLGDPPDRWHPVAWLGKLIGFETRMATGKGKKLQFTLGAILVLFTAAALGTVIYFLTQYLENLNTIAYIITASLILKSTFSIRGLVKAASRIKREIVKERLGDARQDLNWLVSRNTSNLNREQVVSAAIESVAENTCDSFVAPVMYFLIFGIPGAVVYRIVNTFDAMIGYHGKWEYFGKFAARFDDVLNYIPARISALLLVAASWALRKNASRSCAIMWRDHGKTESPNAGWTMSAVAGALGIRLKKTGCYRLGDDIRAISTNDIDTSLRIASAAAGIWAAVIFTVLGVIIAAA
jgi:adenosylcobinamide-phosphate synthase